MREQRWSLTVATPVGPQSGTLVLHKVAESWTGEAISGTDKMPLVNVSWTGQHLRWEQTLTQPVRLTLRFDVIVDGDRITGTARAGPLFSSRVSGHRQIQEPGT